MSVSDLPPEAIDLIKVIKPTEAWVRIIPAPANEPVKCPVCNDGRWITLYHTSHNGFSSYPAFNSHEGKYGVEYFDGRYYLCVKETFPCHACGAKSLLTDKYWEDSGLQVAERDWGLDYYTKLGKDLPLMSLTEWLESPRPTGMKILYGSYGMGKSGMGKALVSGFIRAGIRAHYTTAEDFLRLCRSSFKSEGMTEETIFALYAGYKFLVIDEVDPERITSTEYGRAQLFGLLNKRYDARPHLATLLISNQEPDQLWGYLASRMEDAERIPVAGTKLRGRAEPELWGAV